MNTNHLKKFAQEARRKLLEQVGAKLHFVLTTDSAELREKTEQLKQLRQQLSRTTKEQLIEKVAYAWFNRLMALRFMDVNDYQPLGIRIITPKDGYTIPELLDEAKRGNIHEELKVNRQKIFDLLDNKIPSTNPQNEVFKELLIATCNHLNTTFPFLFERINDYTELLLSDDLTSDFSIVKDVRDGMTIEDCNNVEIIGWLYQFYISEKKDEVFASKSKIKKEDIPAATQLFTPRWIVEYMVQNTVGKLWLQNRPKSSLREHMQYFIESATLSSGNYLKISSPEEIKLLDPASGSGHILVYAFDLFTKIYEEEGYSQSDIPKLIIEKNLYGFEIDERAAQLSGLALMMKAREYNRRAFKNSFQPNIHCFHDLWLNNIERMETLSSLNIKVSDKLKHDLLQMQQATNFGSLIIPQADKIEIIQVTEKLSQLITSVDVFQRNQVDIMLSACMQLFGLGEKFHCLVTNPPYMGGNMNDELSEFVKSNYPDSKADLMACFMESGLKMLKEKGFLGMINQHSWMFLSSYEKLRGKLIRNIYFDTLLHLGARTFPEIGGEVVQSASFTFWNTQLEDKGIFIRLVDSNSSEIKKEKTLEAIRNHNCGWLYVVNQIVFEKIPNNPIAYWLSERIVKIYASNPLLRNYYSFKRGIATGDNDRFLRFWFEVSQNYVNKKWFPYNKGGDYRKWSGNKNYYIDWAGDGKSIKNFKDKNGRLRSRPQNTEFNFVRNISYSSLTSGSPSFRIYEGFINDQAGNFIVSKDDNHLDSLLGLMNSKVAKYFIEIKNQTLNITAEDIYGVPLCNCKEIIPIVKENVALSNEEWDKAELSWDFKRNELLQKCGQDLDESCDLYMKYWENKFILLHKNEEELNHQFINKYELEGDLTPNVPLDDITILQDELDRKKLLKLDNKLVRNTETLAVQNYNEISLPFITNEIMAQFIGFSVGCILGRYSLDKEGLILANKGETIQDYLQIISKSRNECSFLPDEDNITPILDDEWFEDDIVDRFYSFLKATFGEKNFNKNLAFIEEQIGEDIRKYFIKDFYSDHIKRYKKRPIYWMFSSPKGSFNVLIYMHRYTPDTVSNILNKYFKEFIGKLNTRKEHLERVKETGSASEKSKAFKESDNIQKMLVELHEYERDILYPLATERIEIDLDDGVLVNYNKFGKAVKEVSGLNDPATKKKVKQFDWIDATQIR